MKYKLVGSFRKFIYKNSNFNVVVFQIETEQNEIKKELGIEPNRKYINIITKTTDFELNILYEIEIENKFNPNSKYINNFHLSSKQIVLVNEKNNIIKYLSSSKFKGINKKTATKIVENLNIKLLSEIDLYQDELFQLVGENKAKVIIDQIENEKKNNWILDIFLKENLLLSIFDYIKEKYGQKIQKFLEEEMIDNLHEFIQFNFHDYILVVKCFSKKYNNELYNEYLVLFEALKLENEGSTKNEISKLFERISLYIAISIIEFKEILKKLFEKKLIVIHSSKYEITSTYNYNLELTIAKKIKDLINQKNEIQNWDLVDKGLLDIEQLNAVLTSLENGISIISGGPGTGKTLLIKIIVDYFNVNQIEKYQVLAPTGKAAIQISQRITTGAKTFHSFLKWNKHYFEFNDRQPTEVEYLIIDEFSMINIHLFYSLLIACPKLKQLIIIGDKDQLPAIGSGYILNDFINCQKIPVSLLKKIYRQEEGNLISQNSIKINENTLPIFNDYLPLFDIEKLKEEAKQKLLNYVTEKTKQENINEVQILIPVYGSDWGIDKINELIQNAINKNKKILFKINDKQYFKNDKVIQLENDIDKNVFNGEIGYINSIELNEKNEVDKILISFEGDKKIEYSLSDFTKNISLAYAISIHKFQGSECNHVIIIIAKEHSFMVTKKMLYTAYTRAKKSVAIFSTINIVKETILNDKDSKRKSNIINFLNDL